MACCTPNDSHLIEVVTSSAPYATELAPRGFFLDLFSSQAPLVERLDAMNERLKHLELLEKRLEILERKERPSVTALLEAGH